jgi:hypothetical protein
MVLSSAVIMAGMQYQDETEAYEINTETHSAAGL